MREKTLHVSTSAPSAGGILNTKNESSISLDVSGTFSGLEGNLQVSMDAANWNDVSVIKLNGLTKEDVVSTVGAYEATVGGWKYVRFNIENIGTGAVSVVAVATGVMK